MVGHRPSDWHVLDLDKDPTPGDPARVRRLARFLHDFADDVSEALRLVKGMAGEGTLAEWAGKSAKVFKEEFSGVPKNLRKLEKSYAMCGDALADYWPKLERAQALADKALAKAREAQADLSSAKSKLASAESWVGLATKEADKYKDDPTGSKSDADKPDEAKVRAATRDVRSAKSAQEKAQSDVTSAQSALDAAKKMAADARKMREEAARDAKSKIDEASDAGIQNRSWWEEIGDWFTDNWDNIVAACKIVVAVVGIVALIIGGPILGAIVLIAALVVLADTLYKYSKGQASLWDVGLAALDCIPGMKGLTTLGGLAKGDAPPRRRPWHPRRRTRRIG
ncbi:putative T7SS-secreted protein, partial [Micromonospora tulbaghiae]|uniref:putative T7SS-secreted protein n=1 Tax=Micromonospora tulbaghiae TaxID=479978 RepID=UPI0033AAAA3A